MCIQATSQGKTVDEALEACVAAKAREEAGRAELAAALARIAELEKELADNKVCSPLCPCSAWGHRVFSPMQTPHHELVYETGE